jgi:hypothetical protein
MAETTAAIGGKPKMSQELRIPLTRDACVAWFQSLQRPGAGRFQLLDGCLVLAKNSSHSWANAQVVGEVYENPLGDSQ